MNNKEAAKALRLYQKVVIGDDGTTICEALKMAAETLEKQVPQGLILDDAGEDIIRCRDCKHYNNGDCDEMPKLVSADDYCSWAEKE